MHYWNHIFESKFSRFLFQTWKFSSPSGNVQCTAYIIVTLLTQNFTFERLHSTKIPKSVRSRAGVDPKSLQNKWGKIHPPFQSLEGKKGFCEFDVVNFFSRLQAGFLLIWIGFFSSSSLNPFWSALRPKFSIKVFLYFHLPHFKGIIN